MIGCFSAEITVETWERTSFSRFEARTMIDLLLPIRADTSSHSDGKAKSELTSEEILTAQKLSLAV